MIYTKLMKQQRAMTYPWGDEINFFTYKGIKGYKVF
ncbi:MAG: hypothetical protein XD81_1537 [Bacteroidetes bacterium 38_7]|nr:MAG: hypothetical protein XD81_1537 [Bacteroidetes bacterium 38_7]